MYFLKKWLHQIKFPKQTSGHIEMEVFSYLAMQSLPFCVVLIL